MVSEDRDGYTDGDGDPKPRNQRGTVERGSVNRDMVDPRATTGGIVVRSTGNRGEGDELSRALVSSGV